jgi:subtilisin family serine protease
MQQFLIRRTFANILRTVIPLLVLFIFQAGLFAQNSYWIFFTDKNNVEFDPYEYFDTKAILRRKELNLVLFDTTDLPVRNDYIKQIKKITGKIKSVSRWFNAVSVYASANELEAIDKLDFVKKIIPVSPESQPVAYSNDFILSGPKMELLVKQTERLGGNIFEEHGIDGKGVRIAVFDGGFPEVNTNPVFEHIISNGRIIKTYDFVRKKEYVYRGISHGTMVLSCIAGIYDSIKMGLATGAEFLLARTEKLTEPFSEEENWLAAAEWADKNGADIINSSLGYTYHRYFPSDMDGKTSLVARAANLAASKGMLVVNAMGNDGTRNWEFLGTPADADSVLSVGGINPSTDYHIDFSSYGPTYDKRMKPNVSAFGEVIAAGRKKLLKLQGTSFSAPLISGFAACVKQLRPEISNTELFTEIEKSGHLYPYYDYAHGYGIPQAGYFFNEELKDTTEIIQFYLTDSILKVKINDQVDLENNGNKNLLLYHIENSRKILDKYAVIKVYQHEVLEFPVREFKNNEILRVHFRDFTASYEF